LGGRKPTLHEIGGTTFKTITQMGRGQRQKKGEWVVRKEPLGASHRPTNRKTDLQKKEGPRLFWGRRDKRRENEGCLARPDLPPPAPRMWDGLFKNTDKKGMVGFVSNQEKGGHKRKKWGGAARKQPGPCWQKTAQMGGTPWGFRQAQGGKWRGEKRRRHVFVNKKQSMRFQKGDQWKRVWGPKGQVTILGGGKPSL